jgi:Fe2+ or Zn2+ uptake regulation protein
VTGLHHTTLRDLKLKVTPKRMAILDTLASEPRYMSPEEVWERLKGRFARIGLPTVYRNLDDLFSGGVISKVILPDRQLYYFYCPNKDHHHHFVCLSCRRVEDVRFCGLREIEREVKRMKGTVFSHILQINGLCRSCTTSRQTR